MIYRRILSICGLLILLFVSGCTRKPSDGYRPPIAEDGIKAQQENWRNVRIFSGRYRITFRYSDGDKISLRGDMVIEPNNRTRVDLSSDRGNEAVVTITPEFTNLLNYREKYFIREPTTASTAERMVGIYLPAQETASLISGQGFGQERFEQVFTDAGEDGATNIRLFHNDQSLRAEGEIDPFGRLRSIRYYDAVSEEMIIDADYLEFRLDSKTGLVWPTLIIIALPKRGEQITIKAADVDIDSEFALKRRSHTFARLESGTRLFLDQIPPGDPLLYRNLKVYVEEKAKAAKSR